jgi:hypothetical protein
MNLSVEEEQQRPLRRKGEHRRAEPFTRIAS